MSEDEGISIQSLFFNLQRRKRNGRRQKGLIAKGNASGGDWVKLFLGPGGKA